MTFDLTMSIKLDVMLQWPKDVFFLSKEKKD
jgi:hypothetical protein